MMGNRNETALHTQPVVLGVSDNVAPGSMTDEPHVLLLCTGSKLEFKQGENGSH